MKDDPLFLDYEQINELIRMLTDIRFKLLGAVPAASAAIISLVVEKPNQSAALLVGFFGLMFTGAISLYELRNSQLYDAAIHRGKGLEQRIAIPLLSAGSTGGSSANGLAAHLSCLE